MKNIRIPVYGMLLEIAIVLLAVSMMSSCITRRNFIPYQLDKTKIQYKFPNVLETQPKLAVMAIEQ